MRKYERRTRIDLKYFLVFSLGGTITLRSPIHGLSNFNRYVIFYEEKSQKQFEKIQEYVVQVCVTLL